MSKYKYEVDCTRTRAVVETLNVIVESDERLNEEQICEKAQEASRAAPDEDWLFSDSDIQNEEFAVATSRHILPS